MAHSYSNFADAFADLCASNSDYRYWTNLCFDDIDTSKDYANGGNYKWGIRYNNYAISALATAIDQIIAGYFFEPETSAFYESIYWASQEGGDAEIDMSMILDAMWDAEGGQPLLFISYIDAMRGAVGEKRVHPPYLASYLRHFM